MPGEMEQKYYCSRLTLEPQNTTSGEANTEISLLEKLTLMSFSEANDANSLFLLTFPGQVWTMND